MQGPSCLWIHEQWLTCGSSLQQWKAPHLERERVRIALDVARGIFYLHQECEVRIIHGNISPKNIQLDDSWLPSFRISGKAGFCGKIKPESFRHLGDTTGCSLSDEVSGFFYWRLYVAEVIWSLTFRREARFFFLRGFTVGLSEESWTSLWGMRKWRWRPWKGWWRLDCYMHSGRSKTAPYDEEFDTDIGRDHGCAHTPISNPSIFL